MKKVSLLTGATAILTVLSVPAFAQTEIATGSNVAGVTQVDDRITDIEDDVQDSFDRANDADRFGPADRRQGLFGTMSLSYSGTSGNSDAQDLAVGGRVSYNQGPFAQNVGLTIEFGENDSGEKDQEEVSGIYDAQYYFNDRFYAFALGRFTVDGLVDGKADYEGEPASDVAEELTDFRRDGFLGFGPGYRVINMQDTTWRVQAGVGVRYTQTGQQYLDDDSETETGYIASSRFYHRFNDQIFLTNDTDYLSSDEGGDLITNSAGVTMKVSDQLATRISYDTEYRDDRATRTDNTVGLSVVYGF